MAELWWISVGGAKAEPARLVKEGRTKTVFTIGCQDGTSIPHDGIILVQKIENAEIPMTDEQALKAEKAWERKVRRDAKKGVHHGYRRFD